MAKNNWFNGYTGKSDREPTELRKQEAQLRDYFQTINAYSPVYQSFTGGIYEMELTRSCIHTLAKHCSKANPVIKGKMYKKLEKSLQFKPNSIMTTSQYLYKLASIYFTENNVFIIPLYADRTNSQIIGFYPVSASNSKIVEVEGELILKYRISVDGRGQVERAIPYSEVGHMKSHYYKYDLYGDNNNVLNPTLQMLNAQKNSIIGSVEQSAVIRFLARMGLPIKDEDVAEKQKRIRETGLASSNNQGVMIFDGTFTDVKQINSTPYWVDPEQNKQIKANAFNFFGVNEAILQNDYTEDQGNAFFEGSIEPFLIEAGQVHTTMLFNMTEVGQGSQLLFESSAWQYASNKTKLLYATQYFDRGAMNRNQMAILMGMPEVDGGDEYYIRGEYINTKQKDAQVPVKVPMVVEEPKEPDDVDEGGKEDEDDIER